MKIMRIPALENNYIWLLYNKNNECILIDPGESLQVLQILQKFKFILQAILLTHDHQDHVNGIHMLIQYYPNVSIYGPIETKHQHPNISVVSEKDNLILLNKKFRIINLPGHTSNHIGFYSIPWLFCGDTVFSAGCGKFKDEHAQSMYTSFLKISTFPHNTLIFCGHEYTLSNINFAISILPNNKYIINYHHKVIELIKNNKPTIPTQLSIELQINIFFNCNHTDIKKNLNFFPKIEEEWQLFLMLRKKKDAYHTKST